MSSDNLRNTAQGFALALLLACSGTAAPAQTVVTRVVPDAVSCGTCTLVRSPAIRFTAPRIEDLVEIAPSAATVDGKGRFWFAFDREPLRVYDASGAFLKAVGRAGQGPGEFEALDVLLPLPGDSLLLLDAYGRRGLLLDPNDSLVRQFSMPQQLLHPIVRAWPAEVVVSARLGTPAAAGFPLHVVSLRERAVMVRTSFGVVSALTTSNDIYTAYEYLAATRGGGFVSVSPVRYALHLWSRPGVLQQTLTREAPWFGDPSSGRIGTPTEPPSPRVVALHLDADGRIWSFVRVAAPTWRSAWSRFPAGARETTSPMDIDRSRLTNTMVEIIDAPSGRVLLRETLQGNVLAVLPGVRVLLQRPRLNGDAEIVVEQMSMRRDR